MIVIDLPDEIATEALAARLAAAAAAGDVIALSGPLGVGKTAFARAFLRSRGERGDVPSPTFTLVQLYELPSGAVWHFDLYRLREPEEGWELGIEDAFRDGIALIEWPDRLGALLPPRHLSVAFAFGDNPGSRRAMIDGPGEWLARLAPAAAAPTTGPVKR